MNSPTTNIESVNGGPFRLSIAGSLHPRVGDAPTFHTRGLLHCGRAPKHTSRDNIACHGVVCAADVVGADLANKTRHL